MVLFPVLYIALAVTTTALADTPSRSRNPAGDPVMVRAERGDAEAQYEIALAFAESEKFVEAANWFAKAAAQGHCLAQCNLGALYAQGLGVPRNALQAYRWYKLAADQGDAMAMYNLGTLYSGGLGDLGLAVQWFQRSAELGYPPAQANLGLMYWYGRGVERDTAQSLNWLLRAAHQKDANALFSLAAISLDHSAKTPDAVQAFAYLSLSAIYGNPRALAARKELETTMTVEEIREGQNRARKWKSEGLPHQP